MKWRDIGENSTSHAHETGPDQDIRIGWDIRLGSDAWLEWKPHDFTNIAF